MKISFLLRTSLLIFLVTTTPVSRAQTTTFTYQGFLTDQGAPANGAYDLTFTLFNASIGGSAVGTSNVVNNLDVTSGLFTVPLDFGSAPFDGSDRWLEIALRPGASAGAYTHLVPRQPITSAPYTIYAATANTAANVGGGAVVKTLNALLDDVTLMAGTNVTITPSGNTLTIASIGAGGSGIWNLNGADTYFDAGNVGIGTNSPTPGVRLDVNGIARVAPGGSGGFMQFGSPNGETGMTISGTARADIRFDGSALKLLAGPIGGPPASANGIAISTNGDVGIGTTSPSAKLEVAGDTRINGELNVNHGKNGNVTMTLQESAGDSYPFLVKSSVEATVFYLATGSPHFLQMNGNAYKSAGGTSWIVGSDRRLKQDIRMYDIGLNEVLRLRPVRFHYRDDAKRGLTSAQGEVGFIAQEVREVIPDAVTEDTDGYLSLKADPIHWV